jgi:hypothetical protein
MSNNYNSDDVFAGSPYKFQGIHVPRVTEILSKMVSEDYLMYWAQKMGRYNKDIDQVRDSAADKGTIVHQFCEDFLRYRFLPDYSTIPQEYRKMCMNAFHGFMMWINNINDNYQWKPLMIEHPVCCDLYGGTLDALLLIGGKTYLIDFKTSNYLSWKYTLQVAAYRRVLREIYGIDVDGCCILRLDKYRKTHPEEMMFDLSDPQMRGYMDSCEALFVNLAMAYWQRMMVENEYKNITGMRVKG